VTTLVEHLVTQCFVIDRLDPDEEAALSAATLEDIMALADILNTNPQDFVMEAYADPLQYFPPDPPNETNPQEVLTKLKNNDSSLTDVCLNNVGGISEKMMCEIFEAFRNNDRITRFSATNCDVSMRIAGVFCKQSKIFLTKRGQLSFFFSSS
jgi:hypothetical protein